MNVAVAWALALNWTDKPSSILYFSRKTVPHSLKTGPVVVESLAVGISRTCFFAPGRLVFTLQAPEDAVRPPLLTGQIHLHVGHLLYDAFRSMVRGDQARFSDQSELATWDHAIHTRAGWPSLGLIGIQRFNWNWRNREPNPRQLLGAVAVPEGWAGIDNGLALPLRPIWPGFAINTAFYAAILWLLTLGPLTTRRMIRRKRGDCIKCGYDLRGAEHEVCPECGAARDRISLFTFP